MNKSIVKTLSFFLALVLALSMMPIAAFATEWETRAVCTHPNVDKSVYDAMCVYTNSSTHTWYRQYWINCVDCGFAGYLRGEALYAEAHNYQYNGRVMVCSDCGHVK